jgi:hypothetical protein
MTKEWLDINFITRTKPTRGFGIRAKEVTLTYKLPLAWRTPPSGGKNLRKEEFFTQEHLVEPMGVEPTTSRVRF